MGRDDSDGVGMERTGRFSLFAGACFLCAVWLRFEPCSAELWLDEILSLFNVLRIDSWVDIFTRLRIDNNHPLVSLYLYALGIQSHWFYYHFFSLLTGIGTVVVLWRLAASDKRNSAGIVLVLSGFSFLFINYSSEARGYAPAAFFSLLAFQGISDFIDSSKWRAVIFYTLAGMLALLSSLTSVIIIAALMVWSGWELLARHSKTQAAMEFLRCHGALCLFLVLYDVVFISKLQVAGGGAFVFYKVVLRFFSFVFGVDGSIWLQVASGLCFCGLYLYGLYTLGKDGKRSAIALYVLIFPIIPFGIIFFLQPSFLYIRYFFVCLPFILLLFGRALWSMIQSGKITKVISLVIICGYVAGNIWAFVFFEQNGQRGEYEEAVVYILAQSPEATVSVSSDHDLRNGFVLRFYAALNAAGSRMRYLNRSEVKTPPAWYIEHSHEKKEERRETEMEKFGASYHLVRVFPYGHLSGYYWYLYKKG